MSSTSSIRTIEELSLNALPALQTVFLDGWVLRFANGYTRRANSVNPLYPVSGDVPANVHACERTYARFGLRTLFKLTPAAQPGDLDDVLAQRGYSRDTPISMQTLNLSGLRETAPPVELSGELTRAWLTAYCTFNQAAAHHQATLQRMLEGLVPSAGYALLRNGNDTLACGLGVVQAGFVGLFDIITAPHARRQGLGQQLVASLLAWGKRSGAHTAYLQVMSNNEPALRLYSRFGFQEEYQYWYRSHP